MWEISSVTTLHFQIFWMGTQITILKKVYHKDERSLDLFKKEIEYYL